MRLPTLTRDAYMRSKPNTLGCPDTSRKTLIVLQALSALLNEDVSQHV